MNVIVTVLTIVANRVISVSNTPTRAKSETLTRGLLTTQRPSTIKTDLHTRKAILENSKNPKNDPSKLNFHIFSIFNFEGREIYKTL